MVQRSTETINSLFLSLIIRIKVIVHKCTREVDIAEDDEVLQLTTTSRERKTAFNLKRTTLIHSTSSEADEIVRSAVFTGGNGIAPKLLILNFN